MLLEKYPMNDKLKKDYAVKRRLTSDLQSSILSKCDNMSKDAKKEDLTRKTAIRNYIEDFKQDKFNRTLDIIRDLELYEPK